MLVNFGYQDAFARGFSRINYTGTSFNQLFIYKGTLPADVNSWTPAGSSSDLLATFTSFYMNQNFQADEVQNVSLQVAPSSVTASASGTAAWFAMNRSNTDAYGWVIGDVSLTAGTAMVRLNTLTLTSGVTSVSLTYFGLHFG